MDKPIILVTGTAGTGKTTLAKALVNAYDLDHRLGTGFVREIVRSQTTPEQEPFLFEYTFRAENPVDHMIRQARRLFDAIDACIERARREGTSLVIEGNHLTPELYHNRAVAGYLVLTVRDDLVLASRLHGKTHTKRTATSSDFENIRKIDAYFLAEATRYRIPMIETTTLEETLEAARQLIR